MINYDLVLREYLEGEQREPDGLLHPSTHLDGNVRHAYLDVRKHPHLPMTLSNILRLKSGTWWHDFLDQALKGTPTMRELDLGLWLPYGWAGTCDCLLYEPSTRRWRLKDYKTTDNMAKKLEWGLPDTYRKQINAYWTAVNEMGLDVEYECDVVMIPIAGDTNHTHTFKVDVEHPWDTITEMMVIHGMATNGVNGEMPPIPDDLIHLRRNRQGVSIHRQNHMSRLHCPFPSDVCGCKVDDVKWKKLGDFTMVWGALMYTPLGGDRVPAHESTITEVVDLNRINERFSNG